MPTLCFCACSEISVIPGEQYTYEGYYCLDGTVPEGGSGVFETFTTPIDAPFGRMLPVGAPCTCGPFCREPANIDKGAMMMKAAPAAGLRLCPCDLHINADNDILGQWNAKTSLLAGHYLRLILLGKTIPGGYKVFGLAYLFNAHCAADQVLVELNECQLEYTDGDRNVWIGTKAGKQVGPFRVQIPIMAATGSAEKKELRK